MSSDDGDGQPRFVVLLEWRLWTPLADDTEVHVGLESVLKAWLQESKAAVMTAVTFGVQTRLVGVVGIWRW